LYCTRKSCIRLKEERAQATSLQDEKHSLKFSATKHMVGCKDEHGFPYRG